MKKYKKLTYHYKKKRKQIENTVRKNKNNRNTYISRVDGRKIQMRSTWEVKFAHFLDSLGQKFLYEPFPLKTSFGYYFPDFFVPESKVLYEVKGRWLGKSKEKFEQASLLYKDMKFIVLQKKDLQKLGILK